MLDVQWVPSEPGQFITWGGDLRHYSVVGRDQVLLSTLSEPQFIRCVAVWGGQGVVLAAGQATGRVSFVSFQDGEGRHLLERDLPARVTRQVTALSWAPGASSVLATGFEKHRTDPAVVVWDLAQGRGESPLLELGMMESCSSVDWFRSGKSLAVGLAGKSVKILDPRLQKPAVSNTNTRATDGVTVDPSSDFRLAGHVDNQIQIWDIRNFEKPVVSLEQERAVTLISWCPTRPGLLASTARDSGSVQLHDIMSWPGQEDGEPSVTDRRVEPPQQVGNITGFSWHPEYENTLLVAGNYGKFSSWQVSDRLTLNWSVRHCLVWAGGKRRMKNITLDTDCDKDIAVVMQERARRGYGSSANMRDVGENSEGEELRLCWVWCQHSADLLQSGKLRSHVRSGEVRSPGVRTVLRPGLGLSSQLRTSQWTGVITARAVRTYCSEQREAVLALCGGLGDSVYTDTLSRTAAKAAAAVFSLDLRRALRELQAGASTARNCGETELASALTMVSVALSGFSDGDSELWREMVGCSLSSLPHPALRAIFSFLTVRDGNYSSVLEEDGLLLVQRISFAATFLDDESLETYLESEWLGLVSAGRLEAVVLSGGDSEVLQVLQSYLDRTADVQTVSWLAVRLLSVEAANTEQVAGWLESYRTLLDQWAMFSLRTELDIAVTGAGCTSQDSSQVFVCCHFCGKSISPWYKGLPRGGQTGSLTRQGVGGNKPKIQSCPYCKKPLPRCAVCLVNMGTASGTSGVNLDNMASSGRDVKLTNFSSWFTWCQTCRHGGHAGHLTQWFSEHSDCPVTGCTCKCAQLD